MTAAIARMELRLRARTVASAGIGLIMVAALVGALFPALGTSIGDLKLPRGVDELLGGGGFSTVEGWLRTEIASVYGPLVFAGVGIASAAATLAGEEEAHVLAVILGQPVPRARLVLAKAGALALELVVLAAATFGGLVLAVALAGGGLGTGRVAALALHLLALGLVAAALALAVGAATGRRAVAAGVAASVMVAMFLVNGFAPVVSGAGWLRYLTAFHYAVGTDPLANGPDAGALAVLLATALALVGAAVAAFARRDLRG